MQTKVIKFGGSSLADAAHFKKVAEIVKEDPARRYVIPSAPGKRFKEDEKVTDMLYGCFEQAMRDEDFGAAFDKIVTRYEDIIRDLGLTIDLSKEYDKIKGAFLHQPGRDYAASRGEYLNALILANYLGFDFIDAAKVIFFKEDGSFDSERTNVTLSAILHNHPYAVIPGFYGSMPNGTIKTFSRGGSDVSGSIVARAVHADLYENWTDVSGFLMADPRIVKNPKQIETISYMELRELSYMGASVLHEEAIFPAEAARIPINIRNTNRPEDRGTMITAKPSISDDHIISGIAGRKNFTVIALYKNHLANEKGFIRRLAGIIEDYDMTIEHIPTGIDTMSVVLDNRVLNGKLEDLVEEIENQLRPDRLDVVEDMALIATVGAGMAERKGTSAKLFAALADAGVNIRMIDQGSSEMNIIVGVENKDFDTSIKAIYEAFVE